MTCRNHRSFSPIAAMLSPLSGEEPGDMTMTMAEMKTIESDRLI